MREIQTRVRLVVCVLEVVYPHRRVGINVDNIRVQEVVVARQAARDCLAHDVAIVVDIRRILGYERIFGRHRHVGVVVASCRVDAVLALRRLGEIVGLVAVVHLRSIEFGHTRYRIQLIDALNGALLVFRRVSPRNRFFQLR